MQQVGCFNEWQLDVVNGQPAVETPGVDGQVFLGARGCLAVTLHPLTLIRLRHSLLPTHWLVPLEDGAMANEAASLPGEVLWLSRRHPALVVGQLQEEMRGAWLEGQIAMVNLDGATLQLRSRMPVGLSNPVGWLAGVVADLWVNSPIIRKPRPLGGVSPRLLVSAAA